MTTEAPRKIARRSCVIGSVHVDLTFRTPRFPRAGETLTGYTLQQGMGGKAANQADAAARLGADVTFVACVGNDSIRSRSHSPRIRPQAFTPGLCDKTIVNRLGTAAIVVDDNAENCIIVVPGANAGLTPRDVRHASAALQQADAVVCQRETPREATQEAFRIARAPGKLTVLTPAPVMELPDALLGLCDVCVPKRTEAEVLNGRAVNCHEDVPQQRSR